MNRLGISFKSNNFGDDKFRITPGKFPLIDYFQNDYRFFKDSLRNKGFLYLEQILYKGSYSIREWDELKKKFKGPTPKWWNVLRAKVTNNDSSRLTEDLLNEVDVSDIMFNNKPILPYIKIDGRKRQWIIGQLANSSIIYGQLLTRKQEIKTSSLIKLSHFTKRVSNNNTKKICLEKCVSKNCLVGNYLDNDCVVMVDKTKCNIIIGNVRKVVENCFVIKQRRSNIERELIITIKQNISNNNTDVFDNSVLSINVSPIVEKERDIFRIGDEGDKTLELVQIYRKNCDLNKHNYVFYTDGSLKPTNDIYQMALGWILLDNEENNNILFEFSASNFGWPSSTKAELLALITAILTVTPNSSVKIYTDSNNVITQFAYYKKEYSYRRKLKMTAFWSWETVNYLINRYNINLELIKVKAHSGNWANEQADLLAKRGLNEQKISLSHYSLVDNVIPQWYNQNIEWNLRKSIKQLFSIRNDIKENNLKRIESDKNVDKKVSYSVLNNQIKLDSSTSFETFKESKLKIFKFKIMVNELPVLEVLKRRYKDIYSKDLLCIRCNKQKESVEHIWECKAVHNEIIQFELDNLEWLRDTLHKYKKKFYNIDTIIDKLYKYTRFKKTLKDRNTIVTTEYYRNNNSFNKRNTYIWDGTRSLDDLIKGWIPVDFINIFKESMVKYSKKFVMDILNIWSQKILSFIKTLWCKRNVDWHTWEKININKPEKRKKNSSRKAYRERAKRKISGRRSNYCHDIDEEIYVKCKKAFGLNFQILDFQIYHDKRIRIFFYFRVNIYYFV